MHVSCMIPLRAPRASGGVSS